VEVLRVEMRLVELLAADRVTVPLNPFVLAKLMFVELVDLAFTIKLDLEAVKLKSTPATVTVVDADSEEDVPVTVITALPVTVPAVTVRVAFCFPPTARLTALGVILVTKPQAQPLAVALRFTVPLKLPRLVTVIVELTDVPAGIVSAGGLEVRLKPRTSNVTSVSLNVVPLNALTVTM
jgi:hypothetical protein